MNGIDSDYSSAALTNLALVGGWVDCAGPLICAAYEEPAPAATADPYFNATKVVDIAGYGLPYDAKGNQGPPRGGSCPGMP